jgi:hypothetical protein
VTLALTTGVVHRDAHGQNMIVHVLNRPVQLRYEIEGLAKPVTTQASNLLLQRMDWSEGLPAKSMDPFLVRAYAAQRGTYLGYHARQPVMADTVLPQYTSVALNDLLETLAVLWRGMTKLAKTNAPLGMFVTAADVMFLQVKLEEMIATVSVAMAGQLGVHLDASRASEANELIADKVLVEGGWNVPDSWFAADDALLLSVMGEYTTRMPFLFYEGAPQTCFQVAPITVRATPLGDNVRYVEDLMSPGASTIGQISIDLGRAAQEKLERRARQIFDSLLYIFGRARYEVYEGNRYVQLLTKFWGSVTLDRKSQVEDMMIELVMKSKAHPQLHVCWGIKMRLAQDPTALAEARQVGGMCMTELVQLANAACRAIGIPYPFLDIE